MVEEVGTVIESSRNSVTVRIQKQAACEGCHSCLRGKDGISMIAKAHNSFNADIGDIVKMEGERVSELKGGFLLFILPLLFLFVGYLTGEALSKALGYETVSQTAGILTGLLFFAIPFLGLYLHNKRQVKRGKFQLRVVNIIRKDIVKAL